MYGKNIDGKLRWAGLSSLALGAAVGHFNIKKKENSQSLFRNFAVQNALLSLSTMFGMASATSGVRGLGAATRVIAIGMTGAATSIPTIIRLPGLMKEQIELQKKTLGLTLRLLEEKRLKAEASKTQPR